MNIELTVVTNARKRHAEWDGHRLKVKLTAQPLKGKANEELIEYLAEILGLKRSEVRIVRGEKDKKKVVSLPVDKAELGRFFEENARVTKS
jgi:hypothetical protein